jgi:hypothetical protein
MRTPPAIRVTIAQLEPRRAERLAGDLHAILSAGSGSRGP